MFGKDLFIEQLKQLGYTPEVQEGTTRVVISYTIGAGKFKDHTITIGIEVPGDFAVTCPTGPHISPRLIDINTGATDNTRSAESPFGAAWQYLSRPFPSGVEAWNRTSKDAKAYMRHIKRILETL